MNENLEKNVNASDSKPECCTNEVETPKCCNAHCSSASQIKSTEKSQGTLGIVGFIVSIISLFIAGIPLGITAFILSLIGILKKQKQIGFAIAGLIISIISVILAIIMLSQVL